MHTDLTQQSTLFRSPTMRALLSCEAQVLSEHMNAVPGRVALSIASFKVSPLSASGHQWTHLTVDINNGVSSPFLADASALPIADESMDLVLMQHVTELAAAPLQWVHEANRILSPGGTLLVTGLHPCSLWHPWLLLNGARHEHQIHLQSPFRWRCWLQDQHYSIDRVLRFGAMAPGLIRSHSTQSGFLAAAFLLKAHKCNVPATPVLRRGSAKARSKTMGALIGARRVA